MDKILVDRAHLESLSFSDLVTLADEYGIDVPEDLDRQFLIAELIEVLMEAGSETEEMHVSSDAQEGDVVLPKNYNETQISAVLQNPAWVFVFWNISEADKQMLKKKGCPLSLRICSFENENEQKPVKAFEIQNLSSSQEQFVLLPADYKLVKIELAYVSMGTGNVLASSSFLKIPEGAEFLNEIVPGKELDVNEMVKLSGIEDLVLQQYKNHRQSFS